MKICLSRKNIFNILHIFGNLIDRFENGELIDDGMQDSLFSVNDAAGFTTFLMDNMMSQENLNSLYDAYYQKYTFDEMFDT